MRKLIFVIFFIVFANVHIYADEPEEQLEIYDFGSIEKMLGEKETDFDLKDTILKAAKGEIGFDFKKIFEYVMQQLFKEIYEYSEFIRNIIIICILSTMLKNMTANFSRKEVSELAFYSCYIVITGMLLSSFSIGIDIFRDCIEYICQIIEGIIPLIIGIMMSSGVTAAGVFSPLLLGITSILMSLVKNIFIPFIILAAIITTINYISEREILTKLTAGIKSCINIGIRGIALIFTGFTMIQKIGFTGANNAVNKTVKSVVNMVPVVGDVLTGTVESVMYWAEAIKSGVCVALIIMLIIICFIPIIKILALMITYKVIAIIIQPISDKRITNCIDSIGSFMTIILSATVTVLIMFIFSIMTIMSISVV